MNYHKMPFGKYKGEYISDLPSNYLTYCLVEFDLPTELRQEMFKHLLTYFGDDIVKSVDVSDSKIKDAYKKVSLKFHPDKGGSTEAMQAINEFRRLIYE